MPMCLPHAVIRRALCVALAWLALPLASSAQPASPREELLALVPPDVGLCLVIGDLRGHAQKWERSAWAQSLRQSPLVKALVDSPEARQIAAFESELKKHLGVDWPMLRDDIFGDAVLFAYRPGTAATPDQEQGMVAIRAARPKLLAELVDRFNQLQKDGGELKSLDAVKHQGATYFRRAHVRSNHWYYLHGSLLIVAGNEEMLRHAIERDLGKAVDGSPWPARFRRAGSEQSLAALGINPRAFELFPRPAQPDKPQGFPGLWRALDGVYITLAVDQSVEVRFALQGRPADMPTWARALFSETPTPSLLWQRFPEPALLTVAARNDFANLAEQLLGVLPPADRRNLKDGLAGIGKIIQLDLFRDVLPNVGPDWGVCVLPPADGAAYPQVIAALAVKGGGPERVDEALLKAPQILADLYNLNNAATPIRVDTVKQGKVIVKVLAHEGLFPAGIRPACAVKDGFLLLATSPEAIARFGLHDTAAPIKGETPLLRVSPLALSQLLKHRRAEVLLDLQKKNQLTLPEAERNLDQLLGLLDLFESITFSQRSEPGQASWVLRVQPRMKP